MNRAPLRAAALLTGTALLPAVSGCASGHPPAGPAAAAGPAAHDSPVSPGAPSHSTTLICWQEY